MAFETSHAEVEQLTRVSFAPQVLTDRFEFGVEADHDKLCVFVRVPLLAWRANCDFRFLLDIDAVDNYCVKYATKDEKETEPFSKIMKQVVEKAVAEGKTVKNVFSSLLIKAIGERDYTAQEICGQLEQLPYVRYSRRMIKVNLGSVRALATKKAVDDDDKGHADAHDNDPDGDAADPGCDPDDPEEVQDAATENNVDRYARRHHEESLSLSSDISPRETTRGSKSNTPTNTAYHSLCQLTIHTRTDETLSSTAEIDCCFTSRGAGIRTRQSATTSPGRRLSNLGSSHSPRTQMSMTSRSAIGASPRTSGFSTGSRSRCILPRPTPTETPAIVNESTIMAPALISAQSSESSPIGRSANWTIRKRRSRESKPRQTMGLRATMGQTRAMSPRSRSVVVATCRERRI